MGEGALWLHGFPPAAKSARDLFTGMCGKLNLHGLSSEKAMLRAIVKSYNKFADMCRANAQAAAKQGTKASKKKATRRGGSGSAPQIPADIIAHYSLDLDVLAQRLDTLPARKQETLMHLRTGYETARQIAAIMQTEALTVNKNFNVVYKTLRIQHIKTSRHKRIIVRLAYLRLVETKGVAGKSGSPVSLDST